MKATTRDVREERGLFPVSRQSFKARTTLIGGLRRGFTESISLKNSTMYAPGTTSFELCKALQTVVKRAQGSRTWRQMHSHFLKAMRLSLQYSRFYDTTWKENEVLRCHHCIGNIPSSSFTEPPTSQILLPQSKLGRIYIHTVNPERLIRERGSQGPLL